MPSSLHQNFLYQSSHTNDHVFQTPTQTAIATRIRVLDMCIVFAVIDTVTACP
jgi:hypothetical protein